MDKLYKRYEKICSMYQDSDGKYAGTIAFSFENKRFIFKKEWWESETILVDFEDMKTPIPREYDKILRHSYGDYMIPVKAPTEHGELLFSTTEPYKSFLKEHFHELKEGWYKQTEVGKRA